MSKQKTWFVFLIFCLLGLFLLPMLSCQTGSNKSAILDTTNETLIKLNNAIEENPQEAKAYFDRGFYYQTSGDYKRAIADFNKAIQINPNRAELYYYRGTAYYAKKSFKKALNDYNRAIEIDPEYVNAYINRGFYYHSNNDFPSAIADYKKALEINPNSAAAKKFLEGAIADRQLYQERIRDNSNLGDQGITIRNDKRLPQNSPGSWWLLVSCQPCNVV